MICLRGRLRQLQLVAKVLQGTVSPHVPSITTSPAAVIGIYSRSISTGTPNRVANQIADVQTTIKDGGNQLLLTTDNGESLGFPSVWLRFHCHCSECKKDQQGGYLIDPAETNVETSLKSAEVFNKEQMLKINWTDHEGQIPLPYLLKHNLAQYEQRERHSWIQEQSLPEMDYKQVLESKAGVLKWMTEINDKGMCVLKNVPTEKNYVKQVAELIGLVQATTYGTVFDVISVSNPTNVAYTPIELPLHMDLQHYESPPGIQFFHAIQFDDCVEGGESTVLDVFHVAELFRREHPGDFEILTKHPATFEKISHDSDNPVHMGIKRPLIILNEKGEIANVFWNPGMTGPLSIEGKEAMPFYKAYHKFARAIKYSPDKIVFRLKTGDLLATNNRKTLHGRMSYRSNGGVRHLQGCYVLFDDFISKIKVLSALTGNKKPLINIGFQV